MLVGYCRVSMADDRQTTDLQRDALMAAGIDNRNIYEDHARGAKDDRPGLKACLGYLTKTTHSYQILSINLRLGEQLSTAISRQGESMN